MANEADFAVQELSSEQFGPSCRCGKQPAHPYDELVVFRREGMFYPVVGTSCEDWSHHAELNPGTISIERFDGTRIWPEGSAQ